MMMRAAVLFSLLFVAALACPKGWKVSPDGCQLELVEAADPPGAVAQTEVMEKMATEEPSADDPPVSTAERAMDIEHVEGTTVQLTEDFVIENGIDETGTEPSLNEAETEAAPSEEGDDLGQSAVATDRNDMFEGDIRLTNAQRDFLLNIDRTENKKANAALSSRWPKGIIFYEFTPQVVTRDPIMRAMKHWQDNTCLRFYSYNDMEQRRLAGHNYRIRFVRRSGCFSDVGIQSSRVTDVSLGPGCEMMGIAVHEIGHAIGLWHEQSRPDRDQYVRIHFENVQAGTEHNFQKYDTRTINNYNVRYDPGSIMHYAPMSFSKNGRPTIEAIDPREQSKMGQRNGLSLADIQIVRIMYNCRGRDVADKCPRTSKCLNGGVLNSRCQCQCGFNFWGPRCEHPRRKCGGVINGHTSGVIQTPKYPYPHANSQQCDWTIMAGPNDVIRLAVEDFDVGQREPCQSSWVLVDDGSMPQTLCGSKDDIPVEFQSSNGRMAITFDGNSSEKKKGFRFRYSIEQAKTTGQSDPVVTKGDLSRPRSAKCGSTIRPQGNGVITSPNYPKPYDNDLECAWLIEAPSGRRIRLVADDFDIECSSTCEWDYVTISGAFVMNRFCGRAENFPRDVLSQTNQLLIKFKTDSSKVLKGFKLSYYVV